MGQGSHWAQHPTPARVSASPTHTLLGTEAQGCLAGQEEHLSPELPQPLPPLKQPHCLASTLGPTDSYVPPGGDQALPRALESSWPAAAAPAAGAGHRRCCGWRAPWFQPQPSSGEALLRTQAKADSREEETSPPVGPGQGADIRNPEEWWVRALQLGWGCVEANPAWPATSRLPLRPLCRRSA